MQPQNKKKLTFVTLYVIQIDFIQLFVHLFPNRNGESIVWLGDIEGGRGTWSPGGRARRGPGS